MYVPYSSSVSDTLTTCGNPMLTWPESIPDGSLMLIYQSGGKKKFKTPELQAAQHSLQFPINTVHHVRLSKTSKVIP